MAITASRFLTQFKELKSRVEAGAPSAELKAAFDRLLQGFKATYSSETLKEALASDAAVPSDLEERLTSALILHNRERSLGDSQTAPPPEEAGEES